MPKMFRQGDLLFVRVDKIPSKARKRATKVILEGEATGHKHRISHGADIYDIMGWPREETFLSVEDDIAEIVHEEHGTITLDKGVWQVIRQREYNDGVISRVAD